MNRGRVDHAHFRELIGARLDRPLTRLELRVLTAHLRTCPSCRQVEREYREQRERLRALLAPIPPRDLWARTSAALDREVARGSYRGQLAWRRLGFGPSHRPGTPSAALITSLAALGVIGALGVMQLMPSMRPAPPSAAGVATPYAVVEQPLAFVGSEAADMFVFQTSVGHVCPQNAPECAVDEGIIRSAVSLPARVRPRNLALSPSGHALALVGRYVDRDLIAVLMLPDAEPPAGTPDPPAPGGAGSGTPPETPAVTDPPPTDDPGLSTAPETPVVTPPSTSEPPTETPADTPTVLDATPPAVIATSSPPPSAVPGLRVLAILDDVQSAGAPPAWSNGAEMLAFSAMPADGSAGPDVYIWSPGDDQARAITADHASYFASWSGENIVISRVSTGEAATDIHVRTSVIDPRTLEERVVDGTDIWLPVVNPGRSHAVAWRGQLEHSGNLVRPLNGALYMVDWADLDPFADGAAVPAPPTAEPSPSPPPNVEGKSETVPGSPAVPDVSPTASTEPLAATSTPESTPPTTPEPATPEPATAEPATPTPTTAQPEATPGSESMVALDLGGETSSASVVDWQARWSADGSVLGVWIADALGSTWGRLVVLAVDPDTHLLRGADPLLPATLARRGFSLGLDRVAWVAPSDEDTEGELRIRTWGDDGFGGFRLQPAELEEMVPAF